MRVAGTLTGLAIFLASPGIANAKPYNSAMAFAAAIVEREPGKAIAMISGPVEQVAGLEFLPGEKPSGERLFSALAGCNFAAVFDDMPSAHFSPEHLAINVTWECEGKSVRVIVEPNGDRVTLKYLKAVPMIGAPPAAPVNANRGHQ